MKFGYTTNCIFEWHLKLRIWLVVHACMIDIQSQHKISKLQFLFILEGHNHQNHQSRQKIIAYDTIRRSLNNVLLVLCRYFLPFRRRWLHKFQKVSKFPILTILEGPKSQKSQK